MSTLPNCPACGASNTYPDGNLLICPDCSHEWTANAAVDAATAPIVRDSNGTALADGDSVTLIKDLKVRGSSTVLKQGTKIKSIRLGEISDGHEVGCKIDGTEFMLKAEYLKKV
jgi:protein PhnA